MFTSQSCCMEHIAIFSSRSCCMEHIPIFSSRSCCMENIAIFSSRPCCIEHIAIFSMEHKILIQFLVHGHVAWSILLFYVLCANTSERRDHDYSDVSLLSCDG